jgi:hypothetical protein
MRAQGDSLAQAVPVPKVAAGSTEKSSLPVWDAEQLRLAITAAGVALWSWNVDTNRFTMDDRAFDLWGVPLSEYVTYSSCRPRPGESCVCCDARDHRRVRN